MTRVRLVLLLCALGGLALAPAGAQLLPGLPGSPPPITIDGNKASVTLGAAGISVDLTLEFEQVVGLSASNLGISARAATPLELLARLPSASLTSLPAGFPLLVTIEPPASGGLSFSGVYSLELHTHDLIFTPDSPLRLFKAPLGGPFADVTGSIGMGSYRVRSTGSGFSQFLIIADLRPAAALVELKLDQLDALLASHAASIPGGVLSQLQAQLGAARAAWNGGDALAAITAVNTFSDAVKTAANAGAIPNVWRSARDIQNVAGSLRAAAATLRFSLSLAS
jgi:hypothetical protein